MRSTPKLVMGVTLIMGVSLLLVLALLLVLFAELYCSLLRKRRCPLTGVAAAAREGSEGDPPSAEPLQMSLPLGHSAYSHGVLCAPRGFYFPFIKEQEQQQQSHRSYGCSTHFMGLISPSSSPMPSLALSRCPPAPPLLTTTASAFEEHNSAVEEEDASRNFDSAAASAENFIYISNPIFDNSDEAQAIDTPFETPDTSPSYLPPSDADDSEGSPPPANYTPPLTPMKKLPPIASSVTLVDGRSLLASVSATDSNEGSSSPWDSPCTSPSW